MGIQNSRVTKIITETLNWHLLNVIATISLQNNYMDGPGSATIK